MAEWPNLSAADRALLTAARDKLADISNVAIVKVLSDRYPTKERAAAVHTTRMVWPAIDGITMLLGLEAPPAKPEGKQHG